MLKRFAIPFIVSAALILSLTACQKEQPELNHVTATPIHPPAADPTPPLTAGPAYAESPIIDPENVIDLVPAARLDQGGVIAWTQDSRALALGGPQGISFYEHQPGTISLTRTIPSETEILAVAFSPDGRTLAAGGFRSGIQLWDVTTGELVRSLEGGFDLIRGVLFAPDGQSLVAYELDFVRQWEVASGRSVFADALRSSEGLSISPDGHWMAVMLNSPPQVQLRTLDGTVVSSVDVGEQGTVNNVLRGLAFHPNGEILATVGTYQNTSGGNFSEIRLWRVQNGQLATVSKIDHGVLAAQSVAFSPDGRVLATGAAGGQIVQFWDAGNGRLLHTLQVPLRYEDNIVEFSPDGRIFSVHSTPFRLAYSSAPDMTYLWEVGLEPSVAKRPLRLQSPQQMGSDVWQAEERLDELGYLETDWADGIFDPRTEAAIRSFQSANQLPVDGVVNLETADRLADPQAIALVPVPQATLSPATPAILAVDSRLPTEQEWEAVPSIWDRYNLSDGLDLEAPGSRRFSIVVTSDQPLLWPFYWCASDEKTLSENLHSISVDFLIDGARVPMDRVLELETDIPGWKCHYWATMLTGWASEGRTTLAIQYHLLKDIHDGVRAYPAGDYLFELLVDVATQPGTSESQSLAISSKGIPAALWVEASVAWSPNGKYVAQGTPYSLALYTFDLRQATLLGEGSKAIVSVAWSPDGRRLASAEAAQQVTVWDPTTRQPVATLRDFSAQLLSVAWSPDGTRLATSSADEKVRIWDANTYTLKSTIGQLVDRLAWSPTGDRLAGTDGDWLFIWDADTGELRSQSESLEGMHSISWTSDGKRLITSDLNVWDAATGEMVGTIGLGCAAGSEITNVLSPDGGRIAGIGVQASGIVGCVIPLDSENFEDWIWLPEDVSIEALTWSPDSQKIASAGYYGVDIWDAESGARLASADNPLWDEVDTFPSAQALSLERLCSTDANEWHWRLRNPNAFDVDIHWEWADRSTEGPWKWVVLPAARDGEEGEWVVSTPRRGPSDSLLFYSGANREWKAAVSPNAAECVP